MAVATVSIRTDGQTAIHNVTASLEEAIPEGASSGCLVSCPHTTAALLLNEAEPHLLEDIVQTVQSVIPPGEYGHDRIDDNAAAHLRASLFDSSIALPLDGGSLDLGTWQSVLLLECDWPRTRRVTLRPLQ